MEEVRVLDIYLVPSAKTNSISLDAEFEGVDEFRKNFLEKSCHLYVICVI